ncbi:NrfD/PsrC family molybdoenzyme membrane anchor subunit [Desulfobulbus alkaliphilus]|uniref:NrfD/PsrC family molybdoenzyme membrane anchor subunit n=1 Tax=Desulfobulbus alkaliphilus TaxID=869814 RepID=UPI0019650862|nr:NrfD/PsrC family molybdoenzyme membrane anchor subunit [Desulfobulbus alkaliphilus]MBM9537456.1 polysulfide reductase NrfD [Desulfobulbus alkaliphilus]
MNLYIKTTALPSPSMNQILIFVLLTLICGIGLSFGLHTMLVGHSTTFGTTREVPWGLLITPYVFFACMSTGLCIISTLGQVFGVKTLQPLVTRAVFLSIISMAAGLLSITLELESPWRVAFFALFSPQPFSNIWWKTTIYSFFMVLMVCNFLLLLIGRNKSAMAFAAVAFVAVTVGNLNMNTDMAILGSRGFWSENYMPLYFLSLSVLTGCAAILLLNWFSSIFNKQKLLSHEEAALQATGRLFFVLLLAILYFTVVKAMGGFFPQFTNNPEAMALLVKGYFAQNFWIGEVGLAVIVPLFLIIITKGKNLFALAVASFSCLIGVFVLFYHLVIVGQLIPHFQNYHVVGLPQYYSYSPSLHEIMISVGAIFFFLAAFIFGEILFKKMYSLDHSNLRVS